MARRKPPGREAREPRVDERRLLRAMLSILRRAVLEHVALDSPEGLRHRRRVMAAGRDLERRVAAYEETVRVTGAPIPPIPEGENA